ncbi:hypothetical protein [Carnobacterium maltaromaticum]|uniref:hypothetical protein n=1 Tax=Carnobacterium maltaromaticum TaxID=2751 RepID=UPI00295EAA53|nr:hypothetical protein [Carnobacterium maltaromaticum]
MGLLSTIIESLFKGTEINKIGNTELWREAKVKNDKEKLEQYDSKFKQMLAEGQPVKQNYAAFLLTVGRSKEGKKLLEESLVDKEIGSEKNYVLSLKYYFAWTGKAYSEHQDNPWLKDLISQAEKNVELSIPDAHMELANIYDCYFNVWDKGSKERINKIEELYLMAIKNKESRANYNYASYLNVTTHSDSYQEQFPKKSEKWLEAKYFYLESLKKEKEDLAILNGERKIYDSLVTYNYHIYQLIEKK